MQCLWTVTLWLTERPQRLVTFEWWGEMSQGCMEAWNECFSGWVVWKCMMAAMLFKNNYIFFAKCIFPKCTRRACLLCLRVYWVWACKIILGPPRRFTLGLQPLRQLWKPEGPESWEKEGQYYEGNWLVFEMGPSLKFVSAIINAILNNKKWG